MNDDMNDKDQMSLRTALRIALNTMYQALDEIDMMEEEERKYLRITQDEIIEAAEVVHTYMKEVAS